MLWYAVSVVFDCQSIPVAVLVFTFYGGSGVAIIAAGGALTYIATVNHP